MPIKAWIISLVPAYAQARVHAIVIKRIIKNDLVENFRVIRDEGINEFCTYIDTLSGDYVVDGHSNVDMISIEMLKGEMHFKLGVGYLLEKFNDNTLKTIIVDRYQCVALRVKSTNWDAGYTRGVIGELTTDTLKKEGKAFHRLLIKCDKKLNWCDAIESDAFQTKTYIKRGLLVINIRGIEICVIDYMTREKEQYLLYDSTVPCDISEFEEACYHIGIALAYLTGYFHNNYGLVIQYDGDWDGTVKDWKYSKLRGSIKNFYKPHNVNFHSFVSLSAAEKAEVDLLDVKPVSQKVFQELCGKITSSSRYQVLILLLLEGISSTLITAPSLLSVALEEITTMICEKNKDRINPIKEKSLAQKVRKAMIEVLKGYKDQIDEPGMKVIETRLNNLNSPTNSNKLVLPFELNGISLQESEVLAIKDRNKFLHGEVYHRVNESGDRVEIENLELLRIMLRLFHLISLLVLKDIGFSGVVLNHVKLHIKPTYQLENELLYRRI